MLGFPARRLRGPGRPRRRRGGCCEPRRHGTEHRRDSRPRLSRPCPAGSCRAVEGPFPSPAFKATC